MHSRWPMREAKTIPPDALTLEDYARHFAARAAPPLRAYVDGAAGEGLSRDANRSTFDAIRLLPRVLAPLRGAGTGTDLFGPLDWPVLIAPTACHLLCDPGAEAATAAAAALTGTVMVVSTQASMRFEEIAAARPDAHLWVQIYLQPRRQDSRDLVLRAAAAGARAILVTVDAPLNGLRIMERRAGFVMPAAAAVNLAGYAPPPGPSLASLLDAAPGWEDLRWLVAESPLPVLVKGILAPADAECAIAAGAAGIVVSNHGGRVLDGVPAAVEALPAVVARVAGRVPVLMDGGVQRGTDVVRALALGARAVLLGRPVLHGLAVGGLAGVAHVLTLLRRETELAMALCGAASLADIGPDSVLPRYS